MRMSLPVAPKPIRRRRKKTPMAHCIHRGFKFREETPKKGCNIIEVATNARLGNWIVTVTGMGASAELSSKGWGPREPYQSALGYLGIHVRLPRLLWRECKWRRDFSAIASMPSRTDGVRGCILLSPTAFQFPRRLIAALLKILLGSLRQRQRNLIISEIQPSQLPQRSDPGVFKFLVNDDFDLAITQGNDQRSWLPVYTLPFHHAAPARRSSESEAGSAGLFCGLAMPSGHAVSGGQFSENHFTAASRRSTVMLPPATRRSYMWPEFMASVVTREGEILLASPKVSIREIRC